MKILFLDTETTGCEPGVHAVTQVAGIVDVDGEAREEFNFFCRPFDGQMYTAGALEVTGRTVEEIRGFPDPLEVHKNLKAVFARYVDPYSKDVRQRFVIGGQNIEFDYRMMEAFFKRCGDKYWYAWVDRRGVDLIQAAALLQAAGRIDVPDFKLATLCASLGIGLVAHDAMNDVRATRAAYYKYVEMIRCGAEMEEPGTRAQA